MGVYLVTYDNGEDYEMNEQKDIGIFDTYDKAKQFTLSKGFLETEDKNFFIRSHNIPHTSLKFKDYIFIEEFELNMPKEYLD